MSTAPDSNNTTTSSGHCGCQRGSRARGMEGYGPRPGAGGPYDDPGSLVKPRRVRFRPIRPRIHKSGSRAPHGSGSPQRCAFNKSVARQLDRGRSFVARRPFVSATTAITCKRTRTFMCINARERINYPKAQLWTGVTSVVRPAGYAGYNAQVREPTTPTCHLVYGQCDARETTRRFVLFTGAHRGGLGPRSTGAPVFACAYRAVNNAIDCKILLQ